ncbi:MAG: uroporphyrinogen decarboxylase family protein [Kiritimatiellales bacterium]
MTDTQWQVLLNIIRGETVNPVPAGFIIDSPWLPGWFGCSTLDYFASDEIWFEANRRAVETFPEIIFLPGFWSEYGMCTEPSAFGSRCMWNENNLPHADRIVDDVDNLPEFCKKFRRPDVTVAGMLPFVLSRVRRMEPAVQRIGHQYRFAVARGPLNILSFLMGTTDSLMALKLYEEETHFLLNEVSEFLVDWIGLQLKTFPAMDGILLLDDIIGFLGEEDCRAFAVPYLKKIYGAFDVSVKFLHNDAEGRVCAPFLPETGVNLFNFSFNHSIPAMQKLTKGQVALLGNIPPRDVLAQETPSQIENCVRETLSGIHDKRRLILSAGGGMPQDVSTENINAFLRGIK